MFVDSTFLFWEQLISCDARPSRQPPPFLSLGFGVSAQRDWVSTGNTLVDYEIEILMWFLTIKNEDSRKIHDMI